MKKPTKKSNLSLSVNEFKSWMSGVEDMQEPGWVPNKVQWDRIRSKIALLSDDVPDRVETQIDIQQMPMVQNQMIPGIPQIPTYDQMQQPTYYEPQQFTPPAFGANEGIRYASGEAADFI